jgi:hypothetical protein
LASRLNYPASKGLPLPEPVRIDKRSASPALRADYAHIGLLDIDERKLYIAKKPDPNSADADSLIPPIRAAHASLLLGGSATHSVPEKDRFLCYWFHTPRTGSGLLHGYPIEWDEGHVMIRLDPYWDYKNQRLLKSTDSHRVEQNIEQQYKWGCHIFESYAALRPTFPLSWHLIGPRPADSMFYVARREP